MARELNMDTQRQNFWKESIQKEAFVRLSWHDKYSAEFSIDALERKKQERLKKFTTMVPKLPRHFLALPVINYPKKKPMMNVYDAVIETINQNPNDIPVEMRAVTPDVRDLLYNGFTKEGRGRYQYLQTRKLKNPEEKYEYPLTTSSEYGWKLNENQKEFRSPKYGRSRIVRDTFFRRTGILYEPSLA